MAGRLIIMRPQLTDKSTITINCDNKIVAQELHSMRPRIEAYLRKQMQNKKLQIQINTEEQQAAHRIYSRTEQFQILEQRNPILKRLKEALDLDLI